MDEKEVNSSMREKYDPALKTRVAIEGIRGINTAVETAKEFDVPSSLIGFWKKFAPAVLPEAERDFCGLARSAPFIGRRKLTEMLSAPEKRINPKLSIPADNRRIRRYLLTPSFMKSLLFLVVPCPKNGEPP